jgi:uncharacterized membrane protein YoaT (DUF817 family)
MTAPSGSVGRPNRWRARLTLHRQQLRRMAVKGRVSAAVFEFVSFGVKQAWACIFAGTMLAALILTFWLWPGEFWLARYDALVLVSVALQGALLLTRLESLEEARVILVFHIAGTVMELFKTYHGSWAYPEESVLRIGAVPLFSGFMYAAVGSYLARVWRIFEFRFDHFPPLWAQGALAVAIYVNFFAHHWIADLRGALFVLIGVVYGRTIVWFRSDVAHRPMPLIVGFGLVALFIWFAENLATYARAFVYPDQEAGWSVVSLGKYGSWYLLMILSFVLVAAIHQGRRRPEA